MTTNNLTPITVSATINAPVAKVWQLWTEPAHIVNWNQASADWHTTRAENDLRAGGKFTSRMEARDGSMGFDFGGTYTAVDTERLISYTMDDGRTVTITFDDRDGATVVTETFDPEQENSRELQEGGWQAILDSFKDYVNKS